MTTTLEQTKNQNLNQTSQRSCVSAVFKTQQQVSDVIQRLLDRGLERDDISAIGKDLQSETRITGFLTKKGVILDGLKTGAIFGSLFGTFLSLLSGIGVLFIPFIGSVVAAGPLSAVLLGAASGAIAGTAGAGLVSVLAALGMPEKKAAIYQTRVQAGEFLLIAEAEQERTGEISLLLESAGGDEIETCEGMQIPRQPDGLLEAPEDLSPEIRTHLSNDAQQTFIWAYNENLINSKDSESATLAAWNQVEAKYQQDEQGFWTKAKAS